MRENEENIKRKYEELYKAVKEDQQSCYDDVIKFINRSGLHDLRRTELIGLVDKLVEAMGGIYE